jgi:filamentous hemagglutinin
LKEKNLTTQQLLGQGYTDVKVPNGQLIRISGILARPLFFNADGKVRAGVMQRVLSTQLPAVSGLFEYVIVATGGGNHDLRIGVPMLRLGHPELADGWPVYAAGQVMFTIGTVDFVNNFSGGYVARGVAASFVELAFSALGPNATGKYTES